MRLSRRIALATGPLFAASSVSFPALASFAAVPRAKASQQIQHIVIHPDESGGAVYTAPIAVAAPDAIWATAHSLDEERYRAALSTYRNRGYGLRRVNAFQTTDGVRYAATWQWGHAAPQTVRHGMTAGEFENAAATFAALGNGIEHVDACATADGPRFAAIWEPLSGSSQKVAVGLTAAEFRRTAVSLSASGYRVGRIAGYAQGGRARFASVFFKDAADVTASHAIPAATFHARSLDRKLQGYRLADASGYVVSGRPFYSAVWEKA